MENQIYLPVHTVDALRTIRGIENRLWSELGYEPSAEQIAEHSRFSVEKIKELLSIDISVYSLDVSLDSADDGWNFAESLEDERAVNPYEDLELLEQKWILREALATLSERDQDVLRKRNGIDSD